MKWLENFGLGWLFELVVEYFLWEALLFASLGLLVAQACSHFLGIDQELISWVLAGSGFVYGFRHDLADLRAGPSTTTIAVIGYLGLSALLMSLEVLLVLRQFPIKV